MIRLPTPLVVEELDLMDRSGVSFQHKEDEERNVSNHEIHSECSR